MNYCFIHSFSAVPVNRLNIKPLTNINTPSFYDRNKEQLIAILLPISNLCYIEYNKYCKNNQTDKTN
jgi:hypothetical protein